MNLADLSSIDPVQLVVPAVAVCVVTAMVLVEIWARDYMNSLHPDKSALAREVQQRLEATPDEQLIESVRALTEEEFGAYFAELKYPSRIEHPIEACAYADLAYRWSRPFFLRRKNKALEALSSIYTQEETRLSCS
ncbi:hypothetical protein [Mycobacteroides abscessus]|uniref:hypothetical protein n=1 Tax=Mycobacteroides abscessus TaxID=36809 RepID=UPI0009A5F234|nr:hypothetical protein [Mycobacteroides abscessus]SLH41487.1 Uncharacterised protein [Mycobacteroides abscessus subsp. massiliense]